MFAYLGMRKDDFACWFFYMAATKAIHRFGAIVRNLVYVGMAALAANPCVGALAEKLFIHIEKAVVALLVHAGKTSEAMTHETVLCVHSVQNLRKHNYQCECKKARRKAQGQYLRVPSDATVHDR